MTTTRPLITSGVSLAAPASNFIPPSHWQELSTSFRKTQVTTLDLTGSAAMIFDTGSANRRLVVSAITVKTNQAANAAVIPWVTVALNTTSLGTMSQGNQCGTTNYGLINTFRGNLDVGQCDFLTVLWYPPPGSTLAQIAAVAGVLVSVIINGTGYTRRK